MEYLYQIHQASPGLLIAKWQYPSWLQTCKQFLWNGNDHSLLQVFCWSAHEVVANYEAVPRMSLQNLLSWFLTNWFHKWIKTSFVLIIHFYCSGLKKKLVALGKKKGRETINSWIAPIIAHLYWVASENNIPLRIAKWKSLINHIMVGLRIWAALQEKVPNVLSQCPSFGITPTFPPKKFFFWISRCHTKRRAGTATRTRPSFDMTTTRGIRELFVWRFTYDFASVKCVPVIKLCILCPAILSFISNFSLNRDCNPIAVFVQELFDSRGLDTVCVCICLTFPVMSDLDFKLAQCVCFRTSMNIKISCIPSVPMESLVIRIGLLQVSHESLGINLFIICLGQKLVMGFVVGWHIFCMYAPPPQSPILSPGPPSGR